MSLNSTHPPLPQFDCDNDRGTVGQRWEKWVARLENYLVAMNITNEARCKATLLHLAGESVYEVYESVCDAGDDFVTTKDKLQTHFRPMKDTDQ